MITKETLEKLYDECTDVDVLSKEHLHNIGLDDKDIDNMVESKNLQLLEDGTYKMIDLEGLYSYGVKVVKNVKFTSAYKIFLKCFQIDPTHYGTIIQLLIRSIKGDSSEAFDLIRILSKIDDGAHKNDCNLYLFLLSFFTDIPEDLKDYVLGLTLEDISVNPSSNIEDIELHIKIRQLCFNCGFGAALKVLNNVAFSYDVESEDIVLLKALVRFANEQQKVEKLRMADLAMAEDYSKLKSYLDQLAAKHKEAKIDHRIRTIVDDIQNILNTGTIISPSMQDTDNMYHALDAKNYVEAYNYNLSFLESHNINAQSNILCILLNSIVKLMNELGLDPNCTPTKNITIDSGDHISVDELSEYLSHKIAKARIDGITLLDPMSYDDRQIIYDLLKNVSYKDYAFFSIGNEPNKQIVIRHRPIRDIEIDLKDVLRRAREAINKLDHEKAIEYYRQVLEIRKPKPFVFADLGVLYSKIGKIDLAIDYLTVAVDLYNVEKSKTYTYSFIDYSPLLKRLKEQRDTEQSMSIEDFSNSDMNNYYGITNIKEIVDALLSGTTFESLKDAFNLSVEQTLLVALIVAREYYAIGDLKKGDIYLKQVE